MMKGFTAVLVALSSLTLGSTEGARSSEECVSRQEFESLKYDLHYWKNVTLTIFKNTFASPAEDGNQDVIDALQWDMKTYLNASLEAVLNKMDEISSTKNECQSIMPAMFPDGSFLHPVASCKDIPPSSPSGHYWIQRVTGGYATMEYCHMSPPCSCNSSSGWMRVANLDMTDSNQYCPLGFTTTTSGTKTFCRRNGSGCSSVIFPVNGVRYSKVCGKVIGYQYYSMDAFTAYHSDSSRNIDDVYVDGISITHGTSPRSHIWTFANALDEVHSNHYVCPCISTDFSGTVPPFIGSDYFCATGSRYSYSNQWYTADPLWDGEGCEGTNTCCDFNSPPWFCKELPHSTTDDIELRVCADQHDGNENAGVEKIDIFIQ